MQNGTQILKPRGFLGTSAPYTFSMESKKYIYTYIYSVVLTFCVVKWVKFVEKSQILSFVFIMNIR